jgi:hypothetical protein
MFCRRPDLDETDGGDPTTSTWWLKLAWFLVFVFSFFFFFFFFFARADGQNGYCGLSKSLELQFRLVLTPKPDGIP